MTAVKTTKERWCEAEVHRIAGEIALRSAEPDAAKAEAYFEHALAVARGGGDNHSTHDAYRYSGCAGKLRQASATRRH
jgi:hypothetical protein